MAEKTPGFRRIGEEAVRARTGKGWPEWFAILGAWGAPEQGHTESARHLLDEYGLSPWWAQAVAIRYEWERGLRKAPAILERTARSWPKDSPSGEDYLDEIREVLRITISWRLAQRLDKSTIGVI